MNHPVRILLIEDEPNWQLGIGALLATDPRLELSGIADNYKDAIEAYRQKQPQAVLLDWQIKGNPDGLAVGQTLLEMGLPPERIVLISGANPGSIPEHPFLYVPKSRLHDELLPLLAAVTIN